MRGLQRRTFLEIVALGGGAVGCAPEDPGGGRAPGQAPAHGPGGGTPPGETGEDSRAAQGAQAPPEFPDAGWEADWARLVAAATAEGALSLITMVGRGYQRVIEGFERAFPAVRVDHLAESSPGVWLAAAERGHRAGKSPRSTSPWRRPSGRSPPAGRPGSGRRSGRS